MWNNDANIWNAIGCTLICGYGRGPSTCPGGSAKEHGGLLDRLPDLPEKRHHGRPRGEKNHYGAEVWTPFHIILHQAKPLVAGWQLAFLSSPGEIYAPSSMLLSGDSSPAMASLLTEVAAGSNGWLYQDVIQQIRSGARCR